MKKKPADLSASVRQRLLNRAQARGEEFNFTLSRYAIERLLVRLEASAHRARFVLKGATLFVLWSGEPHRATWDLDLLGFGAASLAEMESVFRDVCQTAVADDGIIFDSAGLRAEEIREDSKYGGVRIHLEGRLGAARIPVQIDVGFGDAVFPPPEPRDYPTLLPGESVRVLAYPPEAALAEKLEAVVDLGVRNSRMKDFYDLHYMASRLTFSGSLVAEAIRRTFHGRGTPIPEDVPVGLTEEFAQSPDRDAQWRAFVRRGRLAEGEVALAAMLGRLREFLLPPLWAARSAAEFRRTWTPGGPWR